MMVTRLATPPQLAAVHLVLCALVLAWNLWITGRAARVHGVPRPMAFLAALGGLLLVPALVVLLVTTSLVAGHAIFSVIWVWPATVLLMTAQAISALAYRRVSVPVGASIVLLDLLLLGIGIAHWLALAGYAPGQALLALLAADRSAIAAIAQPLALITPWFLFVPMFAPVSPGRRGAGTVVRGFVGLLAAAWAAAILYHIPAGARAVRSYDRYAHEALQERADTNLVLGLKVLPALSSPPAPITATADLSLADSIKAGALVVYVTPHGADDATLDSLARLLDDERGGRTLVVALDLSQERRVEPAVRAAYLRARVADVHRIARRVRPDVVVPVVDPFGAAARAIGAMPAATWVGYERAAAAAVHAAGDSVQVMVHVGGFTAADSALFGWAASAVSPANAVGVSLFPGLGGAASLDARMRAVDGWMRAAPSGKPVWVLEAGGYPLAHGEESQSLAFRGVLAWATTHTDVKSVVFYQASDYGTPVGLRTADGRLRPAVGAMLRAAAELDASDE